MCFVPLLFVEAVFTEKEPEHLIWKTLDKWRQHSFLSRKPSQTCSPSASDSYLLFWRLRWVDFLWEKRNQGSQRKTARASLRSRETQLTKNPRGGGCKHKLDSPRLTWLLRCVYPWRGKSAVNREDGRFFFFFSFSEGHKGHKSRRKRKIPHLTKN